LSEVSAHSIVKTQPSGSRVIGIPPGDPKIAEMHFQSKLAFETDPSDVYTDLSNGNTEILLVDARTQETYAQGHVPGAINLPWRKIDLSSTVAIPKGKVLVTYCDGVHCNASTKAAMRLAALGFRVKEMLDGMQGWKREGYPVDGTIIQLSAQVAR